MCGPLGLGHLLNHRDIGSFGGSVRNTGLCGISVDVAVPEVDAAVAAKAVGVVVGSCFFDGEGALVFVFVFTGFGGVSGVVSCVVPDPVVVGGGIGTFGAVANLSDDTDAAFAGAGDIFFPDPPVDGGAWVPGISGRDWGRHGRIRDGFGPLDDAPSDGFGEACVGEALGEGGILSAV